MKTQNINDRIALVCAFRYALGRKSYAVGAVTEVLIESMDDFSQSERDLFVREIKTAIENDHAGMDCDITRWASVMDAAEG